MKKILSALISVILLIGAVGITPVMAVELSKNYTFVDTCYSPELGVYIAVAKSLDANGNPTDILASDDGVEWKVARNVSNGMHDANKPNRQTVVWWAEQHCFVAAMNKTLLTSEDGYNWTNVPSDVYSKSSTTVTTNGKLLVIASGTEVRVYESFDSAPTIYNIDANAYGMNIGVTDEEPYVYTTMTQWKTWQFSSNGRAQSQAFTLGGAPFEMVYVSAFEGWILLDKTKALKILKQDKISYTSFSAMKLSDGTDNDEKFTAAGAGNDYVVLGTEGGRMLVAPNDRSSLTVDVPWIIAEGGNGSECKEEIRSITEVNDGMFLVASKTNLFMLMQEGDEWRFYDTAKDDIIIEDTRFEIPVSGTRTELLNPVHYNYKGGVSEDAVVAFDIMSDKLPAGVTYTQESDTTIKLNIASSTKGGHTLEFRAVTAKGKMKTFKITIVDEDHIEITGRDRMAIPLSEEEPEEYEYTVDIIGTDGEKMSRETAIDITQKPDGTVFDSSTNTFTIDKNVKTGEIVFTGYSVANPSNKLEKTISVTGRAPDVINLNDPQTEVFIPDEGTANFAYPTTVYDQIEKEITRVYDKATGQIVDLKLDWTVSPKEIESMDGITINKDTGTLSVVNTSVLGTVTIKAVEKTTGLTLEQDITLKYTDLRMAQEDLAEFTIDTSIPITENIELISTGKFESEITWRSSDENIIETDGTVIRPSREDKTVTLIGTSKKNKASTNVKYVLVVKKADNLCTNGDLADGKDTGWTPMTETILSVSSDGGDNVLNVNGKGAYQIIGFTNDSSYGFEGKVKAAQGSKIKIVSGKGGTIAEITASGGWQDIKGSYDFRKQKNNFEDNIYLECSNGLQIKELKVYEITLELNEVTAAVNRAVYSKSDADINEARTLLGKFYPLPIRTELYNKLNNIGNGSGGSGGGGGGGGGGGSTSKNPSPSSVDTKTPAVSIPNAIPKNDNTADELDTFLLRFKDMKNHWARADVEYMAELGIVNGDENDIFRPDDTVSRAEFATMITLAMGQEATPYANSFFDIVGDDWYSGYVQTVKTNDYMSGYDGLFKPNSAITREELARVIVSAYNGKTNTNLQTGKTLYFNDIDEISHWAYDYIVEAADMGFIYGMTDELFAPKQPATRAQAAVMLKRVYEKLNPSA